MLNMSQKPRMVPFKNKIDKVSCGQGHIIILTNDGDVYTFGSGREGQLGHGKQLNCRVPRLILKNKNISKVAAGRYHCMALTRFGVMYTWGCGESGQLGHDELRNCYLPRIVQSMFTSIVTDISCGEHHAIALSSNRYAFDQVLL